jgi:hypothetical protein
MTGGIEGFYVGLLMLPRGVQCRQLRLEYPKQHDLEQGPPGPRVGMACALYNALKSMMFEACDSTLHMSYGLS